MPNRHPRRTVTLQGNTIRASRGGSRTRSQGQDQGEGNITSDFLTEGSVFARDHGRGLQSSCFTSVYACSDIQKQRDLFHIEPFPSALVHTII